MVAALGVDAGQSALRRLDAALFDRDAKGADRFGPLLVAVAATLVALSLVDLTARTGIVIQVLVSLMLMATVRAAGITPRWRRLADVIAVVAVVGSAAFFAGDLAGAEDAISDQTTRPSAVWVAMAMAMPVAIVRRIVMHRRVGVSTLTGAISAYLLIAFAFTFAFLAVDALGSGDFFGHPEPTTAFMYFSLTCITTLGFGDLTAAGDLGRLLATTEAVVGQIFLVTLVAALVSRFAGRAAPDEG